jgi:hypothetical protein
MTKRIFQYIPMRALSFAIIISGSAFASTNIEVVVEPMSTVSPNNRAAHFNWLVESQSGAEPIIGQFADGSWWVAPASGESGVRLLSLTGSGNANQTDLLTMDDDPVAHANGLLGLGTRIWGNYDQSQDEVPKLPVVYTPNPGSAISLVAAMQRNEAETSAGGAKAFAGAVADAYDVLTVMPEPPSDGGANMIRPNIVGDKKEFLTWADFDLTRLQKYSWFSKANASSIEKIRKIWTASTEVFSMSAWDGESFQRYSVGGRAFRPHILYHNYGAGRAATLHNHILQLFSSRNNTAEIKPALAAIIAHGLDIWHHMYGRDGYPGRWDSGAGQRGGVFTAPALAAALLESPKKSIPLRRTVMLNLGDDPDLLGPPEMRQIKRGLTGVLLWGDEHRPNPLSSTTLDRGSVIRYWTDLKKGSCFDTAMGDCSPNVGQKTTADPYGYIDGPPTMPGDQYFKITLGNQRSLTAIMLLQPYARAVINNDSIIEFVDRVHRQGRWTYPDPVAPPPPVDQQGCNIWSGDGTGIDCQEYMITWGPRADDTRYAHENGEGRYVSVHGESVRPSYTSSLAESNWDRIIELYDGLRNEDTFTGLGKTVHPDIFIVPDQSNHSKVFLWTATHDAEIYYTLDGDTPTAASIRYTEPFGAPSDATVKAIAVKPGLSDSNVNTYDIDALANGLTSTTPSNPSGLIVR